MLRFIDHIHYKHLFFHDAVPHKVLHSFPTRRSSDLKELRDKLAELRTATPADRTAKLAVLARQQARFAVRSDRKSTRLNSSHVSISYAVFCLKKKKNIKHLHTHYRKAQNQKSPTAIP